MADGRRGKGHLEECTDEEQRAATPARRQTRPPSSRAARLGRMQERLESLMSKAQMQRRTQRLPTRMKVNVSFPGWGTYRMAWSLNISRGGMLIQLADKPEIGQKLDLSFHLPNGRVITVVVAVRHVKEAARRKHGGGEKPAGDPRYQVGVEFVAMDEAGGAALDEALKELKREFQEAESGRDPQKGKMKS